jgi:hypothetical protein
MTMAKAYQGNRSRRITSESHRHRTGTPHPSQSSDSTRNNQQMAVTRQGTCSALKSGDRWGHSWGIIRNFLKTNEDGRLSSNCLQCLMLSLHVRPFLTTHYASRWVFPDVHRIVFPSVIRSRWRPYDPLIRRQVLIPQIQRPIPE